MGREPGTRRLAGQAPPGVQGRLLGLGTGQGPHEVRCSDSCGHVPGIRKASNQII